MNLSSPISTNLEQTGYSDANEIMGSQIASSSNISSQIVPAETFHETITYIIKGNPCEIESNVVSKFNLSYQEWTKIKPQFAKVKLQPEWTNILIKKCVAV